MLKHSSILLLIAVAISWSQVESRPASNGRYARLFASGIAKRETEDSSEELSAETEESLKQLLAALLEMTAETPAEAHELSERFETELENHKHENLDEYAEHLANIYEEVTGRNPNDISASSSESEESAVNEV